MSVIASLKNIDPQRYAISRLLDAIEVDINPEDGLLYYASDPAISLSLNEKYLRLNVGTPKKGFEYTSYNPLIREDHAQFLMTILINSMIFSELLDRETVSDEDFTINIENEVSFDQYEGNTALVIAQVGSQASLDGTTDHPVIGEGSHVSEPIAVVFAILDFAVKRRMITDKVRVNLMNDIEVAYVEYNKLSEMRPSERKKVVKEQASMFAPPKEDGDEELFAELAEELGEIEEDIEQEPLLWLDADDCENLEPFDQEYENEVYLNYTDDFVDQDFTNQELADLMGVEIGPSDDDIRDVSPTLDEFDGEEDEDNEVVDVEYQVIDPSTNEVIKSSPAYQQVMLQPRIDDDIEEDNALLSFMTQSQASYEQAMAWQQQSPQVYQQPQMYIPE